MEEFKRSKILEPIWFYDLAINKGADAMSYLRKKYPGFHKAEMGKMDDPNIIESALRSSTPEKIIQHLKKNSSQRYSQECLKQYELLQQSHLFIIGSATLESLINQKPQSYECIRERRMPFEHIFFEFAEPITLNLPFRDNQVLGRGATMHQDSQESSSTTVLYFQDNQNNLYTYRICFSEDYNLFSGTVQKQSSPLRGELDAESFMFFSEDNIVWRNSSYVDEAVLFYFINRFPDELDSVIFPKMYEERIDARSLNNVESLYQLPNLCINLVNYINAHNVTVIKREREVIYLDRDERGKKKKRSEKQPFHLIFIQDKTYKEPEEPKETGKWKLEKRIYVRGHIRRYRDDVGKIFMTVWVPPCIKGPSNAPFANQRYAVLAEKLQREKKMLKEY